MAQKIKEKFASSVLADTIGLQVLRNTDGTKFKIKNITQVLEIPGLGTQTSITAAEYTEKYGYLLLKNNINKELSSYEQLGQAPRLHNDFIAASCNSIAYTRVISYLNQESALEMNFDDLIKIYKNDINFKNKAGEKLHLAIIDDLFNKSNFVKQLKFEQACFVAGTLIHTEKGLVSIQDIKIGDMVLSKPEVGYGDLSFKAVTEKFVSEDKEIWALIYFNPIPVNGNFYKEILLTTAGHPIWVSEYEDDLGDVHIVNDWMRVDEIYNGEAKGILFNGQKIGFTVSPVLSTPDESIGYLVEDFDNDPEYVISFKEDKALIYGIKHLTGGLDYAYDIESEYVPYNKNSIRIGLIEDDTVSKFLNYYTSGMLRIDNKYKGIVYNFTVHDYHTYFVEQKGIWVHNTGDCLALSH